jgi:uncharacterized protein
MSRTLMDTNPLPPLDSKPESRVDSEQNQPSDPHPEQRDLPWDAAQPAPTASSPEPRNPAPNISPAQPRELRESALAPFIEIFLGPSGLYSGASVLIYLALAYVTFEVLGFLLAGFHSNPTPRWWPLAAEIRMMLAAILPGFAMARLEARPFGDFGLPPKQAFRRDFWMGALWGFASLTALMLALAAFGAFSFGALSLHGVRIFKFAAAYALFFLVVAFFEDFLTRGYSLWVLARGMRFWPAAALLSVLFGAMHRLNPGEENIGIAAVVAIGFFFCLTIRRTGTLWFAIGFHMAWDWGETYFYSVPDSGTVSRGHLLNSSFHGPDWLTGGSVGPEGSYLLFILIAALWILFSRAYPRVKYVEASRRPAPDESLKLLT